MENGFSFPSSDAFPAGLRVLVVDDDPTWLKILEKMLKKCSYEVTTCGLAREALNLLRERKVGYDIVVSDVNMPDMDGFKLLEHVGLEMDLPVIMMSVDGETSRVMKGVQHGACDYLLKPIRMKELRNIWQHVLRKKIHEVREIEHHDCFDGIFGRTESEHSDNGYFTRREDMSTLLKKRKDFDRHDDKDNGDASSMKKARVAWSVDLHQKFVKAVDQIGLHRVGPKKILDLMNVPWLTRENVASHLQKYRLYLTRLQKKNGGKSCGTGMKPFELSSNASTPTSCLEHTPHRNPNEAQILKHSIPGNSLLLQKVDLKGFGCNLTGIVSEPVEDLEQAMGSSPKDCNKTWKMKFTTPSELNFAASRQTQIEALGTRLNAESKTVTPLKSDFVGLQSNNLQPNFQVDQFQSRTSISSRSLVRQAEITRSTTTPGLNKAQYAESCLGLRSDLFANDIQLCWLQEDCIANNLGHNIDFTDGEDSGLITDYIGRDYWYDPTEGILIDDAMF